MWSEGEGHGWKQGVPERWQADGLCLEYLPMTWSGEGQGAVQGEELGMTDSCAGGRLGAWVVHLQR